MGQRTYLSGGKWWCPALTSEVGSVFFDPNSFMTVKPTTTIKK